MPCQPFTLRLQTQGKEYCAISRSSIFLPFYITTSRWPWGSTFHRKLRWKKILIFISHLPDLQNISKLHTEVQDLFSTEFSSTSLTLLYARVQSGVPRYPGAMEIENMNGIKVRDNNDSERESIAERENQREKHIVRVGGGSISSKIVLEGKRQFKLVDILFKSSQMQTKLTWRFWQCFYSCSGKKKMSALSESYYQKHLNTRGQGNPERLCSARLTLIAVISWPHIWHLCLGTQFPKSINSKWKHLWLWHSKAAMKM